MSLVTKVADLATRIGTEFKTVRGEITSAQTAAESYADSLASNYDAAGSAAAAQAAAEAYADALTTDDVAEGSTNKYLTDERVQDLISTTLVQGSNITLTYNDSAGTLTVAAASGYTSSDFGTDFAAKTTDNLTEGTTNKYFTNQRALDATAAAYDAAGSADTAEDNAKTYADGLITSLVNGAPSTLDTLNELASALGSDANFSTSTATALGNRVRVDAAQSFSSGEKSQARSNIDAVGTSDVGNISSANFVTTFEAALV